MAKDESLGPSQRFLNSLYVHLQTRATVQIFLGRSHPPPPRCTWDTGTLIPAEDLKGVS